MEDQDKKEKQEKSPVSARLGAHMQDKKIFVFQNWMLYVAGALVFLASSFAVIQQARIWRYSRMLRASKITIGELQARNYTAKLEGMKEVASKQHGINNQEIKEIDAKIKQQKAAQDKLKKDVDRMKPTDLLRSFKEEGF